MGAKSKRKRVLLVLSVDESLRFYLASYLPCDVGVTALPDWYRGCHMTRGHSFAVARQGAYKTDGQFSSLVKLNKVGIK